MALSHAARFVYYNAGPGDENAYALVVGGDLKDETSHLDLAVLNNNGVWEIHRDVPNGDGGAYWHTNAV